MSGHSKWSTIKRQKGANDAKRGQAFTKAGNAITIAAREGGGNPDSNFKLRLALDAAKAINMPKENMERAIARGTGAANDGKVIEAITYEGFSPGGVGVLVSCVTDNKLRTAQEVRSLFEKSGGSLGGAGSVSYLFQQVGQINAQLSAKSHDEIFSIAADAGADDVDFTDSEAIISTPIESLEKVKIALLENNLEIISSEIVMKPSTIVAVNDPSKAQSLLTLLEKLEDLDDVQKVFANFDIPEEILVSS